MRPRQHAVLDALDRAQRYIDDNIPYARSDERDTTLHALDDMVNDFTSHALDHDVTGADMENVS